MRLATFKKDGRALLPITPALQNSILATMQIRCACDISDARAQNVSLRTSKRQLHDAPETHHTKTNIGQQQTKQNTTILPKCNVAPRGYRVWPLRAAFVLRVFNMNTGCPQALQRRRMIVCWHGGCLRKSFLCHCQCGVDIFFGMGTASFPVGQDASRRRILNTFEKLEQVGFGVCGSGASCLMTF